MVIYIIKCVHKYVHILIQAVFVLCIMRSKNPKMQICSIFLIEFN